MGTYSLKEVLYLTNQTKFQNRVKNYGRDVLKSIKIQEIKQMSHGALNKPTIKFRIQSFSYPQYYPYNKGKRKKVIKNRRYKHSYDVQLEMDELSWNTKNFKFRIGGSKQWNSSPPQMYIQSIYSATREKWKKEATRKFKTKKDQAEYVRKKIETHKKRAKFLNVGDYNASVNHLNGDFIFYLSYALQIHGHLFGINPSKGKSAPVNNPKNIVFFPKHFISLLQYLTKKGILKNN